MSVEPPDLREVERMYRSDPDRHADALAEIYLEDGRPKDAIHTLESVDVEPDAARLVLLAQAYFDDFDNRSASKILRRAQEQSSLKHDMRAQLLLGELAFESGSVQDARTHLRAVLSDDPDHERAAQLLRNLGDSVPLPENPEPNELIAFQTSDPDRESPERAFVQVAIGFVILVLSFGVYVWSANRNFESERLARDAMQSLAAGDYNALQQATETFERSLAVESDNEFALSGLAEAQALLWVDHGDKEVSGRARESTTRAASDGIEKAERFSAELLVAYGQGNYADVESLAQEINARGGSSEKVYF
ncbi:MAG: tetratricopeptide repeat protein, partial [Myxococcota bacterium]